MKKILAIIVFTFFIVSSYSQKPKKADNGFYYDENSKLFNGSYKEYIDEDSSSLKRNLHFKDGLLEGISKIYHPNGNIKEVRSYKKGKKHGTWITYSADGSKTAIANYANGKKNGIWHIWDENGTLRYEMQYLDGEKTGTWSMYNKKGKLLSQENHQE
ncbi:MAG: toxin-antitoxin system YwqK family antitoxin [Bacteroidota bacterium]